MLILAADASDIRTARCTRRYRLAGHPRSPPHEPTILEIQRLLASAGLHGHEYVGSSEWFSTEDVFLAVDLLLGESCRVKTLAGDFVLLWFVHFSFFLRFKVWEGGLVSLPRFPRKNFFLMSVVCRRPFSQIPKLSFDRPRGRKLLDRLL
jgi:hypothetical protein